MPLDQLILSKYLFRQGEKTFDPAIPMSCGLSLSLFHDAVECLIWTIVKVYDARSPRNFLEVWDAIHNAKGNDANLELPQKATMRELNSARVNFKHYGILPDSSQATKLKAYAEAFLKETCQLFFKRDFDSLSIIDSIRNSEIKGKLKAAEEALSNNTLVECLTLCSEANHIIAKSLETFLPTVDSNLDRVGSFVTAVSGSREASQIKSAINDVSRYIRQYLDGMRQLLFISLFKMSIQDHLRFKRLVPTTYQTGDGTFHHKHHSDANKIKVEDCKFAIDYLIDYSIQLEARL